MLQPLQLEDVGRRYPQAVAEVRQFLRSAGVGVGAAGSLHETAVRVREERGFRRDLTSHLWAVLDQSAETMTPAHLLGVVAVAAAGTTFAAEAGDEDAHQLLRFVMQAQRSFGALPGEHDGRAQEPRVIAAAPAAVEWGGALGGGSYGARAAEPAAVIEVPAREDRTLLRAGVALACLLLAVIVGILWHRQPNAERTAVTKVQPAPAVAPIAPIAPSTASVPTAVAPPDVAKPDVRTARPAAARRTNRVVPKAKPAVRAAQPAVATGGAAPTAPVRATKPGLPAVTPVRRSELATNAAPPAASDGLGPYETEPFRLLRRPGDPKVAVEAAADTAAPGPAVHITSLGTMASHVTYGPAPVYPKAAVAAHVQGQVKVEAEVSRDGDVTSARVISGPPLLRDAAAEAVEHWKYRPYLADGNKPLGVNTTIVMDFLLP